jgi:hypothetical protein
MIKQRDQKQTRSKRARSRLDSVLALGKGSFLFNLPESLLAGLGWRQTAADRTGLLGTQVKRLVGGAGVLLLLGVALLLGEDS